IDAVEVGAQPGSPRIVVFTGKTTEASLQLIHELGAAGHFKDSIVALAMCGEGGEVPFNTQLIMDSGARGVLFYDERINQVAVKRAMLSLCDIIQKEGFSRGNFQALWRRAIDAAASKDLPAADRAEILRLKGAVLQLSELKGSAAERAA